MHHSTHSTFTVVRLLLVHVVYCAQAAVAAEPAYPGRPIRIIVPTSTGGGGDLSARLIAQRLFDRSGYSVIVENRAGAGTIVGTDIVAKAPADGHTILMAPGAFATNPSTYKKMPFDTVNDFAPITQMLSIPQLIVVHPSLPAKTVKEFIVLAKSRPGELQYAASGHGTLPHLTIELFAHMAQIRLLNVPYKGPAPGIIDLLAGRLAATISGPTSLVAHMRAGKMRALGVTTTARIAALPDVPTIAEAGVPGFEAVQWGGLLVRTGTSRDIIARLHKETTAILRTPEVKDRLSADGNEVVAGTPEEFGALIKAEIVKWARVVKAAGIQPE
jgi:tripartite-type tricarboxylate transporter receptor subunit TctC